MPLADRKKSLLSKKEELVLFPPVGGFVLHIFHMTILPSHRSNKSSPHHQATDSPQYQASESTPTSDWKVKEINSIIITAPSERK
jgi:hypothetical protein